MVPHLEAIDFAEHVHFAAHAGGVAQARMDHDAPLRVDLGGLAEVIDAVEELGAGRMRGWRAREPLFEREPYTDDDARSLAEFGI